MDEFIKELIDLCKKHDVKCDDIIPVETQYIETSESVPTDTRMQNSKTITPPKVYSRYLIKAHTLVVTFRKTERKSI